MASAAGEPRMALGRLRSLSSLGVLLALGPVTPVRAQACPTDVAGAWTGTLPADALLHMQIRIRALPSRGFEARLRSAEVDETVPIWQDDSHLRFQSTALPLAFDGVVTADGSHIGGFLYFASSVTRVRLPGEATSGALAWTGDWTPLGVPVDAPRFDLYVEDEGDGRLGGYFFFRDQRLPALWGYDAACRGDTLELHEKVLGLRLSGSLAVTRDRLDVTATGPAGSAPISFVRMSDEDVPAQPDDPEALPRLPGNERYASSRPEAVGEGLPTALPTDVGIDTSIIASMVQAVADGELPLTHAVLVARRGALAVEEYFYGFDRDTWHDMRSASKTVASTLTGLAIRDGLISDVTAKVLPFFPRYHRYATWDPRKADITIRDLLTMSSGLDANDADPRSVASETAYQSQVTQPDWIKFALDAPMVADPGAQPVYGGANPLILGGVLAAAVGEPVEWFTHRTLFEPLGIEHYRFSLDPTGIVYMGGGLYLRPRDMLKFGLLYLNGGVWQGHRILSEDWIRDSWGTYGRLAPLDRNGHQYGYLWWHHHYQVGGQTIETVEARGNGGQYIFVVPSLDLVVVITAGNYRHGLQMTRQPEEIMLRYVLPAVLGGG